MTTFRKLIKRILDLIIALLLFVPAIIFSFVVGTLIKLDSPGPVYYKQKRYGRNNRPFVMYKFRTMFVDADKQQAMLQAKNEATGFLFKMTIDPRQTNIGRSLRNTGVDEIPQIFNVLKGEMSLVGPRPLPINDVDFNELEKQPNLNSQWAIRTKVRPGITGLWQINPGSHSFSDMLGLDEKYVNNFSLRTDFEIISKTAQMALSSIFPNFIRNPKNGSKKIDNKLEVEIKK
ncbi:MAG: sugar transferase [Patescibacteria group bacterium]|jgi:lipopolysaccharide/colanic/teichoic acid biosynthesis glycosyltransferase